MVTNGGAVLTKPRVVEVRLGNPSRRDILRDRYLNNEPLVFDIGVPIVDVLGAQSEPATRTPPSAVIDGSLLKIGPDALVAKQRCTYKLLVDGDAERVTLRRDPLAGVKLTRGMERQLSVTELVGALIAALVFGLASDKIGAAFKWWGR
ncbi:hypothetical protein ACFCWG_33080 [Streptomyces sp. NPDC056390]|uniref:hypothetical protein n=1 Tax=Streptomyces sp. NPDC056390 TaxID=3345806 RepID=UPI0035DDFADF